MVRKSVLGENNELRVAPREGKLHGERRLENVNVQLPEEFSNSGVFHNKLRHIYICTFLTFERSYVRTHIYLSTLRWVVLPV